MKNIWPILTIAKTGFQEYLRDRFAHICFFIALFLIAMSIALGSLSLEEQTRIMIHFGLTSIHLCCLGLVSFFGAFCMQKETERQTCLLILARPLSRAQFLIGKYLSVLFIMVTVWLILSVTLFLILEGDVSFLNYMQASLGIIFEMSVLLGLAFFFASVVRPTYALFMVFAIYLLGNWLEELLFFATKSKSEIFLRAAEIVNKVIPNLFSANWRSYYLITTGIDSRQWLWSLGHHFAWILIALALASFFYKRKDLV